MYHVEIIAVLAIGATTLTYDFYCKSIKIQGPSGVDLQEPSGTRRRVQRRNERLH